MLRLTAMLAMPKGWTLCVLHVDHGLRGEASSADAAFVGALASALSLPFSLLRGDAAELAIEQRTGIEEASRLLRYRWFGELLTAGELDAIATGHTLDDQAETVLARLLRGAWTEGLAAIYPVVYAADLPRGDPGEILRDGGQGVVVRPLLGARRAELRDWLRSLEQPWREDETNSDLTFTRNRIRHQLLPALASFNPQVQEHLAQTAALARDEEQYWQAEVARVLPGLLLPGRPVRGGGRASSTLPGEQSLAIEVERLRAMPTALARRVLRAVGEKFGREFSFLETARALALLEGAVGTTPRREQLSPELRLERSPRELRFSRTPADSALVQGKSTELRIAVPGEGSALGVHLRVTLRLPDQVDAEARPLATLRAARPADRVQLRYSRGAPKRVKEVLERLGVPALDRAGWPLLEWQGEIVWLRGAVLEPTPLSTQLSIETQESAPDPAADPE